MHEQRVSQSTTNGVHRAEQNEDNVWLFHRGEWSLIDNPTPFKGPLPLKRWENMYNEDLHSFGYERHWRLGGVFNFQVYANYRSGPTYRIEMEKYQVTEIIYAQDLPDLLQVLTLFTPLAASDIQRWLQKMS